MIRRIVWAGAVAVLLEVAAAAAGPVEDARKQIKDGKYDEAIAGLEAALKAQPKNAAAIKAGLAEAHLAYGNFYMYNQQLPPMKKYPAALREFRKVLAYDKQNKKAQENVATIEGIYKSMGRPVPQ